MNRATSLCAKCFVPSCKNTTTNSRNKVFVVVKDSLKLKWCRELNIRYEPARRMFCCEDHLNLEEDLVNYQKWTIMKGRAELKSTAKLRLHRAPYSVDDSPALKSILLRPIENVPMERAIDNSSSMRPSVSSTSTHPVVVDAAVQFHVDLMDKSTSTEDLKNMKKIKPIHSVSPSSVSTSDIKSPSLYGCTTDTETTVTPAINVRPSISARMQLLELITNNPKPYLGIPKQYFWLINHITTQSKTKVSDLEIIITLMKIKLNDPITRMCDQFQISRVTFSKYLYNGIQVLASFFQNLIYLPTLLQIKQNLPLAFKIRYSNVQLIIDAFEIEIQKPHNPVRQAQSWSQYKNGNTIKYLIGCTPNGFVAYVSKGYGGRISDKALVEKSCLIDYLPHNAVIMADRGFKEVEALLATKGIKLLRPPSVYASNKPTKEEVIQTKVVASLRVHVERVIRRVREFRFLKPHSVVSHKHLGYLDHIVLIACGLINLQNEIIKSE